MKPYRLPVLDTSHAIPCEGCTHLRTGRWWTRLRNRFVRAGHVDARSVVAMCSDPRDRPVTPLDTLWRRVYRGKEARSWYSVPVYGSCSARENVRCQQPSRWERFKLWALYGPQSPLVFAEPPKALETPKGAMGNPAVFLGKS